MAPEYEKLFDIYKNSKRKDVVIARLEGGSNEEIIRRYGIASFPTVLLFAPKKTTINAVFDGRRIANEMSAWIEQRAPYSTKFVELETHVEHEKNVDEKNKLLDSEIIKEMESLKTHILGLEEKMKKLEEEIIGLKQSPQNDTVIINKTASNNKNVKEDGKFVALEYTMPSALQTLVGIGALLTLIAIIMTIRKLINQKVNNPDIHHAKV